MSQSLINFLSSPGVSSVPTPAINSNFNLAQEIDVQVSKVSFFNRLGLAAPTASKPVTGAVTGNAGSAAKILHSPKHHFIFWLGLGVIVAIVVGRG